MGQLLAQRRAEDEGPCPPLKTICTNLLVAIRDDLRDVGEMPAALLRPILAACSASQLRVIENETRLGSGRSLKWDTWDLWYRHYMNEFGSLKLGTTVPPIRLPKPPDYGRLPKPSDVGAPGDWRDLYDAARKQMLVKQDATAHKMRQLYASARRHGEKRTAALTEEPLPPPKKKTSTWGGTPTTAGGSKGRLMSKLGIKGAQGGQGFSTPAPRSKGQATSSAGAAWQGKLSAARPVARPAARQPAVSVSNRRHQSAARPATGNGGAPPSRPHPQHAPPEGKAPAKAPAKPAPARLSVAQMISGMKAGIKKQYS